MTIDALVRIVLGTSSVSACDSGDENHDGRITVSEVIVAVNLALDGCL